MPAATVKRVRVRLKATDREGLARVFAMHLGRDRVFLQGCAPIPENTLVILEIAYADRTVALLGRGLVLRVEAAAAGRPRGVEFAIAWDESSRPLVAWILEHSSEFTPHPDVVPEFEDAQGAPPGRIAAARPLTPLAIAPAPGAPAATSPARRAPSLPSSASLSAPAALPPPPVPPVPPVPPPVQAAPSPPSRPPLASLTDDLVLDLPPARRSSVPPPPPPSTAAAQVVREALFAELPRTAAPSLFAVTGEIVAALDATFVEADGEDEALAHGALAPHGEDEDLGFGHAAPEGVGPIAGEDEPIHDPWGHEPTEPGLRPRKSPASPLFAPALRTAAGGPLPPERLLEPAFEPTFEPAFEPPSEAELEPPSELEAGAAPDALAAPPSAPFAPPPEPQFSTAELEAISEPVDLDDLVEPLELEPLAEDEGDDALVREVRGESITEYARFATGAGEQGMADALEVGEDQVRHHTDEVIPRVPELAQWTDQHKVEWERQSGEVTPLARIELVRRPVSDVAGAAAELAAIEHGLEAQGILRGEPVPRKGSTPRLAPRGDVVIGIDLGTTYTCAAIVEDGQARVIPSRRGTPTIPSAVLIHPGGKTIVGEPALRKQPLFPGNTVTAVKRLIGRPYHSPVVQRARRRVSYEIVEGEQGEAAVHIDEARVSLEEISALILKEVRESASLNLGRKVNRAVITCPAYYNERQREAVRTAGELAGFHVERVLSEPTAAALSYGLGRGFSGRRMLVYDLGGGTFDASLLEVDGNVFSVLATGGDTFLGGLDFDACIVGILVEHLRGAHRLDPSEDPTAMAYLFQLAEQAKRDLSDQPTARVRMQHFVVAGGKPITLDVEVKRSTVEALFAPLVKRTIDVSNRVLGRALRRSRMDGGLGASTALDDVILVGGQSRSPIVRAYVREAFGKEPRRDLHPDEVVAIGAARYAASMGQFDGIVLVDTLPISIGIGLSGGRYKRILQQDTPLPTQSFHRIETTEDDQSQLELVVLQGDEEQAAENELIGVLVIRGLPPGPRGSVTVTVTFDLSSECFLQLGAVVDETGMPLATEFMRKGSPDEILARLGAPDDGFTAEPTATHGLADLSGHGGLFSWLKRTLAPKPRAP